MLWSAAVLTDKISERKPTSMISASWRDYLQSTPTMTAVREEIHKPKLWIVIVTGLFMTLVMVLLASQLNVNTQELRQSRQQIHLLDQTIQKTIGHADELKSDVSKLKKRVAHAEGIYRP